MRNTITTIGLVVLLALALIMAGGCGNKTGDQGGPPPAQGTDTVGPPTGTGPGGPPAGGPPAGGPPAATTPSGGPPPGAASGPPDDSNSVAVNATISFADGTKPVTFPGGNDPKMMIFKGLEVTVDFGGEVTTHQGVVRDVGAYAFGTRIPLARDPKSYDKLSKITFHAAGYKDVVYENIPVVNGFVQLKPVVMEKGR